MITLNDDIKQLASEALQKALVAEKMKQKDAAVHLGIHTTYVSLIYTGDEQMKCSMDAWERVVDWVNSGKTLAESNYEMLPLLTKAAFKRTPQAEPQEHKSHYSAGSNNISNGKVYHSLDDTIDKVIEGIMKAQQYKVPRAKWKQFVKDMYFKRKNNDNT